MSNPQSHLLLLHDVPSRSSTALNLFAGVKVLDPTKSVACLYAGQLLADIEETVVKVKKLKEGNDARAWRPPFLYRELLWFLSVNHCKPSIELYGTCMQGHGIQCKLISQCDVISLNFARQVQRKLGSRISDPRSNLIASYQVFETFIDLMMRGVGNNAIWKHFWQSMGHCAIFDNKRTHATTSATLSVLRGLNSLQGSGANNSREVAGKRCSHQPAFHKGHLAIGRLMRPSSSTAPSDPITPFHRSDSSYGPMARPKAQPCPHLSSARIRSRFKQLRVQYVI